MDTIQNYLTYEERGKYQISWEKTVDTSARMTQVLELFNKEFKTCIIKMLQQAITSTLKANSKRESFSKEIEDIKKNQMERLELKTTVT